MSWTERQQAMLLEMGLRVWAPANTPQASAGAEPAIAPEPLAAFARQVPSATRPLPPVAAVGKNSVTTASVSGAVAVGDAAKAVTRHEPAQGINASPLDWPALRQAVASCTACGLCESRQQAVFGAGLETAHWLVVCEAPTLTEDEQGATAVGAEGQLLDSMLAALALSRGWGEASLTAKRSVFVTNAVKCKPPSNRNATPDEVALCGVYLKRQIELLQPRVVLALGAQAAKALLGRDEPLGRLRGQAHPAHGTAVVVSYSLGYLLRQRQDKANAWEDLCLAAEVAQRV